MEEKERHNQMMEGLFGHRTAAMGKPHTGNPKNVSTAAWEVAYGGQASASF